MKKTFIGLVCLLTLLSCGSRSGNRQTTSEPDEKKVPKVSAVYRVKILENGTISYCNLTLDEQLSMHPLDTVWVNLATHRIDDTCTTAMKGVIQYRTF